MLARLSRLLDAPSGAERIARRCAMALALVSVGLIAHAGTPASLATDELTYAHAAWLIARGQQPFRDFFLHHFPLSMQLGSLVFWHSDDPRTVQALRWLMVPIWVGTIGLVSALNRRRGAWPVLLVAPLLGSIAKWAQFGTQFRPDPTAVALFCACLVLVTRDSGTVDPAGSRGARLRAFAGGVCFTLATWASQKVVIYGLAFPLLWLVSCWQQLREPSGPRLFRAPLALALGVLAGAVPIAVYLTVTRNWAPLYHWCFEWGVVHETVYPRRDAMRSLWPSLEQAPHVFVLGGVGLALTLRALVREGMTRALHDPDLLVVLAALGTLLSYFMQNAPFGWSAICWFTFTALFAARALAELIAWAQQRFAGGPLPGVAMAATLLVAGAQLPVRSPPPAPGLPPRSVQDELFTHIVQLTAPSDPVYDNTGRAITRPHAHFLFFTDKTARIALKDQLNREIPKAIRARGVTVRLLDERDEALPQPLREFVDAHFVEVLPDLALWGQRYRGLARGASAELEAVRTAQYYVSPGNVVRSHQLRVDGRELREPVLKLVAGMHVLQWQGERPAPAFNVIWLPRNRARLPPR